MIIVCALTGMGYATQIAIAEVKHDYDHIYRIAIVQQGVIFPLVEK
jgi:hypothetical protein